jgi:prevent-host-death family protein
MRYSTQIKPISYVKAHAAALLDRITKEREPIIITQNGEARAVLMDIRSYEEAQERMALLQIMAAGDSESNSGQPLSRADVYSEFTPRKPVSSAHEAPKRQKHSER